MQEEPFAELWEGLIKKNEKETFINSDFFAPEMKEQTKKERRPVVLKIEFEESESESSESDSPKN